MKSCVEFQEIAVAMSRCEPVKSAERERWLAHLADCCECAAMARQQELLTAALGCLRSEAVPPLSVELAALAAFRSQRRRVSPPLAVTLAAAAAGLCLLISPGMRRSRTPQTHVIARSVNLSEQGNSEFIPFPFAQPIEPQEQVDIYRVRVPASAVVSLDASAANAHPGGLVTADLVVGADGVARGIRFVHQE